MEKRMEDALKRLQKIHEENLLGGGREKIEKERSMGKLLPRERIECLVDPGTFVEIGSATETPGAVPRLPCDGAITGYGRIDGRLVAIYATDFTVIGGSIGLQHMQKFDKLWDYAGKWRIPMVWLLDSAGGRLTTEEGVIGRVEWFFWYEAQYSGVVPQICVLLGPCIAGHAYAPCMTDFLLMARKTAHLWLGGPRMVAAATSEKMAEEVGSADYHMVYSGTCDVVGDDDRSTILEARKLLSFLPSNYLEKAPIRKTNDSPLREVPDLVKIVPVDTSKTYDMHDVIEKIVDDGDYFEIKKEYAKQLITCFCHFNGQSVGIVANNPSEHGSILECNACDKYYRFLEVLDAYNIPLVNLIDTPSEIPGEEEENKGLFRHGGKILHLYCTSTIPKISVILREAYADAGSIIMGEVKGIGVDISWVWPIAAIGISTSELNLVETYGKGIEEDAHEQYLDRPRERIDAFDIAKTISSQVFDEIIYPEDTRKKIILALELTKDKERRLSIERKKDHGNPPT